jgi:hypothetical protein
VQLGFSKGYRIEDTAGYLEKGDRKQVYYKDFYSLDDLDETAVLPYLIKAMIVDDSN